MSVSVIDRITHPVIKRCVFDHCIEPVVGNNAICEICKIEIAFEKFCKEQYKIGDNRGQERNPEKSR